MRLRRKKPEPVVVATATSVRTVAATPVVVATSKVDAAAAERHRREAIIAFEGAPLDTAAGQALYAANRAKLNFEPDPYDEQRYVR